VYVETHETTDKLIYMCAGLCICGSCISGNSRNHSQTHVYVQDDVYAEAHVYVEAHVSTDKFMYVWMLMYMLKLMYL